MTYLNDDFLFEGSNKKEFLNKLDELSDHSEYITIIPEDLIIHSVESVTKDGMNIMVIKPELCAARELFPIKRVNTAYSNGKNYYLLSYKKCISKGIDSEEIKEIGFFMEYHGTIILPTSKTFAALCRQIGVSKIQSDADPIRELFIAYMLGFAENFKMLVRKERDVYKCMITYAESHHEYLQNAIFRKIFDYLKNVVVTYYCITQNLTSVRVALKDEEIIMDVRGKRKKIVPSIVINYSDTGEQALSVTGYISINGRGFYVGDPVSNPKWRDLKSLEGFVRKLFEKTIPVMREAIANIKSVSDDETCNLGVCYKEILDDIDISSDIGTKLYEFACEQAENRSCTKLELLFEVLDMAGFINKLCLDSKKKEIPDYAVKNCERKIGKIFDSKVCREVFGW